MFGKEITNIESPFSDDMEKEFIDIYEECEEYTLTSIERMYALYKSIEYIVKNKISGDIVECGVWKGGSCMLAAKTLIKLGDYSRKIYLYDTFEGMTEPTDRDIEMSTNKYAKDLLQVEKKTTKKYNIWAYAPFDMVQKNLLRTNYPEEQLKYVRGRVEETIPRNIPKVISLLRLDTDWYESTKHELTHLFPILAQKGILIIDDYGHFKGAQEAVDEYFSEQKLSPYLIRIDYSGRMVIKS